MFLDAINAFDNFKRKKSNRCLQCKGMLSYIRRKSAVETAKIRRMFGGYPDGWIYNFHSQIQGVQKNCVFFLNSL